MLNLKLMNGYYTLFWRGGLNQIAGVFRGAAGGFLDMNLTKALTRGSGSFPERERFSRYSRGG